MPASSAWTPSTRPRWPRSTRSTRRLAELRREELAAAQERAALAARVEALHVGLNRKDASTALLAATDQVDGLLGSVAALVSVESSYETAVAAAFGAAADAVAVAGLDAALGAFDHLKAADLGRAGLLLGGAVPSERVTDWPELPDGARYAVDVVTGAGRAVRSRAAGAAQGGGGRRPAGRPESGRGAARRGRGDPGRRRAQRPLRGRRLLGSAEPDRGAGGDRRRRAAADRGRPCLRPAPIRAEPAGGGAAGGRRGRRGHPGPAARVRRRAGRAGRAARPAQLDGPRRSRRSRAAAGGHRRGRAGPRLKTSPGWPSWSTGWTSPRPPRRSIPTRPSGTGWPSRPGIARGAEMEARLALRTRRGARPGPGRAGRRAAQGRRGRAAGPGSRAGPAGPVGPGGAYGGRGAHGRRLPGPPGRPVPGPGRRRAQPGGRGADRRRGGSGRGSGRGPLADP